MKCYIFFYYAILFFTLPSFASSELTKTLEKYSKASSLEVQIKKNDEKVTLGTKSTSQGVLKHKAGKIYLVLDSDKKTEFFYNNKKITLVEYPDQDFESDGKRKVTILTKSQPALITGLLKLFSNSKSFLKEFKVVSEKNEEGSLIVDLKPEQKNFKNFSLVINPKKKLIDSIIFIDDVDTKTTLELSNLKLGSSIPNSTFTFKALKSDEVVPE